MWEIDVVMELDSMPFDHVFDVDGQPELCHATGRAVSFKGDPYWCIEYIDSNGDLHYGR